MTGPYNKKSQESLRRLSFLRYFLFTIRKGLMLLLLQGDSGGPLVCRNSLGRWEQIGVSSFGWRYCNHDVIPAVDASIPHYRNWIETVTGSIVCWVGCFRFNSFCKEKGGQTRVHKFKQPHSSPTVSTVKVFTTSYVPYHHIISIGCSINHLNVVFNLLQEQDILIKKI